MNPILLKPEAEIRSQVVVLGRPWATLSARDYEGRKRDLLGVVAESLDRLRAAYDLIVIEGAGSPAEINLKANEIVNMRIAALADAPVLLVGDIDRGGVFASLVGTIELLDPDERTRVAGFVINKFRGDVGLFQPGLDFLTARTGIPTLGVVPYLKDIGLAEEDSVALDGLSAPAPDGRVEIAVVRLPHIANYDDFDPLRIEAAVRFVETPAALGDADLIVIPGTKSTVADLAWLRATGLAEAIVARAGATPIVGVCGGYQMLGRRILDPGRVESTETAVEGLGLLDVETEFAPEKQTVRVEGTATGPLGVSAPVRGYEIHHGSTRVGDIAPWLRLSRRAGQAVGAVDGAIRADGYVAGCYLHGLFDSDPFRAALLATLAARRGRQHFHRPFGREAAFDRLADHVRRHLDIAAVRRIAGV